jgi:hypothetical protein
MTGVRVAALGPTRRIVQLRASLGLADVVKAPRDENLPTRQQRRREALPRDGRASRAAPASARRIVQLGAGQKVAAATDPWNAILSGIASHSGPPREHRRHGIQT